MKRYYVQYTQTWQPGPMSFWVHREKDGRLWYQAQVFEPPLPKVVPGKGFPYFYVVFDDFTFEFASLDELDACIALFSRKNVPSTDKETQARGTGPGSHWYNILPGRIKSWHWRSKAVAYLKQARAAFLHEVGIEY